MVSERESITAKICAFARAWHSTYSRDRIYDDYLAFDYPIKTGDFPKRVDRLEEITRSLGEVMCGGFDHNEIKCVLCSLGYNIDTYMTPEQIQEEYFEGREDDLKAFENVSLISAKYIHRD